MANDGGAAELALIAGRRDHEHATPQGLIERVLECLLLLEEGCARPRLKLITRAPAPMQSMIAAASAAGVALGSFLPNYRLGEDRRNPGGCSPDRWRAATPAADRIPATKVPCTQASSARRQSGTIGL